MSHIGHEVGLATSTVQRILRANDLGRLDAVVTAPPLPSRSAATSAGGGELIHVDVKKRDPRRGGWQTCAAAATTGESSITRKVGYRYLHTAIDDRTRIVYSEILDDEQAATAASFWGRAAAWFATLEASPVNESSPTTAPATAPGYGTARVPPPTRP
ncbi:MAG: DDE-type integrase/transposase/recombinase [Microthrixaceae bacterium]|nr:DDE-type integrase/transposase/recombinase [Microthrixaceae bacterium]